MNDKGTCSVSTEQGKRQSIGLRKKLGDDQRVSQVNKQTSSCGH